MAKRARHAPRTLEEQRPDIIARSALTLSSIALLILLADRVLPRLPYNDWAIHMAASLLVVLAGWIVLVGLGILAVKIGGVRRARLRRELEPPVIAALTGIAQGTVPGVELTAFYKRSAGLVEELMADSLAMQKGGGMLRLSEAAEVCGIPAAWRRQTQSPRAQVRCTSIIRLGLLANSGSEAEFRAGMNDPEELVAIESARALIRSGRPEIIERLLRDLPHQNAFMRALLSEWLRPQSMVLAGGAVPAMLQSNDDEQILTALEVVGAWRRALPLAALEPSLGHRNAAIRAAAWRAVPYALGLDITPETVADALQSEDAAVRAAVLGTIARLKIASCASGVERALVDGDARVRLAASYAAAALGMRSVLERFAASGSAAAPYATEALEKSLIGRLEK